jgi:2'-5' RNA ligase
MHITLHFLGNVKSAALPELKSALCDAGWTVAAFDVALGQPGAFGNRVIWAGIERGTEPLSQLAERIRAATKPFAEHEETRPFNAHVTLGRLRRPVPGVSTALRKARRLTFLPWTVHDFELIRSELSPDGSRYTTLGTFGLPT